MNFKPTFRYGMTLQTELRRRRKYKRIGYIALAILIWLIVAFIVLIIKV